MIGSFGDIVFEVSHDKVRTFTDFSRSATTRWANHDVVGEKPKSEFMGPSLDEVSFKMRFDAQLGMNPKSEMDRLLIMCRSGQAETLIIGGIPIGVDKWVIESVSQNWKTIDGAGRVVVGEADVKIKEYVGW